ncbi:RagB/SusD family nutrient uptake outer membrane protein [Pedobacter punctiformis]|uniref:RagB/SusD family nutrient uptake outer membrane protein n=1 Tax=Pedobacter punctiformis TaxID=3004097 RepID=A0ABT4L3V6_9SPHI|nr:RagB/SusD family nutrient uptake outer membrane protein [Pedobacter sp. HCMS5-2]MCZ4242595.1 RagB/SusD family nutrient uptake outer membrane protein [Pedobacter sp. HCMS5-2]
MKKLLYISILTLACLFFGCKKSALDLTPQYQLSNESFWKSENDVKLAVNGCYGYLSNMYSYAYDDASSDNAYAQYPWEGPSTAIAAGNIDATLDAGYGSRYTYIRRYNYFLANVDKATISASSKNKYIAEVRVLRAFTYYELAKTFGDVPFFTTAYDIPGETAVAPTSAAEVINFAISEIKAVVNDLPTGYSGGRITSGAAWAILTRIQLNYRKWDDAVVSAQKVMGMGYQLFRVNTLTPDDTIDDYSTLVTFANAADKDKFYKGLASYEQQFWAENEITSKENILVSQNITNSSYVYGNGLRTLFPPSDLGGWSSITPTQELVNAYWDRNGNAFTAPSASTRATNYNNGVPNSSYLNEFKNRDTRLYASILFPGVTWNRFSPNYKFAWGKGGNNNSATGYNFKKLIDPAYTENDWDGAQDFPIIRYAEILLAYAEAKNEISGPDATIFAALNDIRDRSGMPAVSPSIYNDKVKLRDLIQNERRIELAGEGQRFSDIRRWNIAQNVMKPINDITNNPVQGRLWQAKFLFMPYPQVALDRNINLKSAQTAKGY